MQYHMTRKSGNKKTGPIPVTTTSSDSCPPSCPFIDAGCYGGAGPLALHWRAVDDRRRGSDLGALCDQVRALPADQLWRHNQVGDLPGAGDEINEADLADLVDANQGRRGFTYSHKPLTDKNVALIRWANLHGFTINVSTNNLAHADEARYMLPSSIPVVTVLPIDAPNCQVTPVGGYKVIACPAEKSDKVTCATCGLCQAPDREYIIGFRAHGTRKKSVDAIARGAS